MDFCDQTILDESEAELTQVLDQLPKCKVCNKVFPMGSKDLNFHETYDLCYWNV